jgi:hypothetical protein
LGKSGKGNILDFFFLLIYKCYVNFGRNNFSGCELTNCDILQRVKKHVFYCVFVWENIGVLHFPHKKNTMFDSLIFAMSAYCHMSNRYVVMSTAYLALEIEAAKVGLKIKTKDKIYDCGPE